MLLMITEWTGSLMTLAMVITAITMSMLGLL